MSVVNVVKIRQITHCRVCGATEVYVMDECDELVRHTCRFGVLASQLDAGI